MKQSDIRLKLSLMDMFPIRHKSLRWFQRELERGPFADAGQSQDMRSLEVLAEQKRIESRVEVLLRQCDALEAKLRQTRTLGANLLDAFLERMNEEG